MDGLREAPMLIAGEIIFTKLGHVYKSWRASKIAQKTASKINKVDEFAGVEFINDATRMVEQPFEKAAPKISNLTNIEEVAKFGKDLSTKNLDEALGGLKDSGWKQIGGEKGSVTTFERIEGNKRFYIQWNKAGMSHSADGKPTQYWKLYKDKISSKKVLFRGSKANNYKAGGRGETYINGN